MDVENIKIALKVANRLLGLLTNALSFSRDITDAELIDAMGEYDQAKKKLADLEKKVSDADDE